MGLDDVLESALFSYSRARSFNFTAQFLFLNALSTLLPGMHENRQRLEPKLLKFLQEDLAKFLKQDAHEIRKGSYPMTVLAPERPMDHMLRFPKLFLDGVSIYRR